MNDASPSSGAETQTMHFFPTSTIKSAVVALALAATTPTAFVGCSDETAQDQFDATAREGRFDILERDDRFYFRLVAGNGETVLHSQAYTRRSSAESGIASVKVNGVDVERYRFSDGGDGRHFFELIARNGEPIGRSENYASAANARRGAETVRRIITSLVTPPIDNEVRLAIEKAAEGTLWGAIHGSEGDYGIDYVEAEVDPASEVTVDLVREAFDIAEPDADGPLAELFGEEGDDPRASRDICGTEEATVNGYDEDCEALGELDAALAANLTDLQIFYFGSRGSEGAVEGTAVTIFIVGRTPTGKLAGIRTTTIWT
ncbi:MAG: DUF1508 domain-containing protein [Myxococcota bacterium]